MLIPAYMPEHLKRYRKCDLSSRSLVCLASYRALIKSEQRPDTLVPLARSSLSVFLVQFLFLLVMYASSDAR